MIGPCPLLLTLLLSHDTVATDKEHFTKPLAPLLCVRLRTDSSELDDLSKNWSLDFSRSSSLLIENFS